MRFLLACIALASASAAADKPNILLLFADDLGRYASAYADPDQPSANDIIKTPVFDRIAKEGALFENAFISAPSCTPSRGSLYTGRHFFRNGPFSQLHSRWEKGAPDPTESITGMPVTLAKNGYHIGVSLKWHIPNRLMGGKKNHYMKHGGRISQYSQNVTKDPNSKEEIMDELLGNFRDFIGKRKEGQPFFYSFNPTNTHRSWVKGSGKALWGLNPDDLKGKLPPFLPDNELVREDFADYLGEAMAFDQACGLLIKELEKMGELDNTLIVISGDHGAPGFPRGKCEVHDFGSRVLLSMRWPKSIEAGRVVDVPVSLTDIAPTFLAAAGTKSPDDPDGENLLPALEKGADDSKLRGWALVGRECHVGSARKDFLPYPVRAMRTPEFLYVKNFKPDRWPMGDPKAIGAEPMASYEEINTNTRIGYADIDSSPTKAWLFYNPDAEGVELCRKLGWEKRESEEFYDLKKDPYQINNLANDPAYADAMKKVKAKLMAELEKKKDPRLNDDAFDKPPYCVESR